MLPVCGEELLKPPGGPAGKLTGGLNRPLMVNGPLCTGG